VTTSDADKSKSLGWLFRPGHSDRYEGGIMLALPRSFCAGSSRVEHIRSAPSSMKGDIKQISYDLKVIQAV
jgi:hypothetical protein